MAKNLSTSIITYGDTLPSLAEAIDGALFYKTDDVSAPRGLYVFGFQKDIGNGFGDQVQQGWFPATAAQINADTLDGFDSSYFQPLSSNLLGIAGLSGTGIYVRTGSGTATTRSITGLSSRVQVSNGTGVSGNIQIDVVEANVQLPNLGGVLPIIKGGLGASTSPTQGGVMYAVSSTVIQSTPAGTAGQVLQSNAAAAPTWVAQSSLSVGNATNAVNSTNAVLAQAATALATPRTIQLTGDVIGSATFDGTSNINIVTASASPTVNLAGNQTVNGIKTFTDIIVGNISGNAATADVADTVLDGVTVTTAQTVTGLKTFSQGVRFPDGSIQNTAFRGAIMFNGGGGAIAARNLTVARTAVGQYRVYLDPSIQGATPIVILGSANQQVGNGVGNTFIIAVTTGYIDIGVVARWAYNAGNTDDYIAVVPNATYFDAAYNIGVLIV